MYAINQIKLLAMMATVIVFIAACGSPVPPASTAPDYRSQYEPLFNAFIHVLNTAEYDKLEGVFAPNFRRIAPDQNSNGPEEQLQLIRQIHATYSDLHIAIGESLYGDGFSFNQWTVTGIVTTEGGSKVAVEIPGTTMCRYADGMITEEWVYYDTAAVIQQLGAASMPHAE